MITLYYYSCFEKTIGAIKTQQESMKHKALKKIEGGKSTQRVNIQKQKIKVQKLHLELLEKLQ